MGIKYGIPFFLISFYSGDDGLTNSETVRFDIVKKEKTLGYINLEKIRINQTTKYIIKSEVNAKILFNFRARSKETYIYKKDTLVYSSIYRTLNSKVKVDQSITYSKGKYFLIKKKTSQLLNTGVIKCNLVRLFFDEPVDIKEVYCDKLKVYVKVIKVNTNTYKVVFPNKSYNVFYYEDGKCRLIEAVGSFYRVELIPNQICKNNL